VSFRPELEPADRSLLVDHIRRRSRQTQIRRTLLRSKGGGRKQIAEVSTVRPGSAEDLSATTLKTGSAVGRTTLASMGMVDAFDGARRAQHGCSSPQGIAEELIARNGLGEIRG
jgi:hypothetical protein